MLAPLNRALDLVAARAAPGAIIGSLAATGKVELATRTAGLYTARRRGTTLAPERCRSYCVQPIQIPLSQAPTPGIAIDPGTDLGIHEWAKEWTSTLASNHL